VESGMAGSVFAPAGQGSKKRNLNKRRRAVHATAEAMAVISAWLQGKSSLNCCIAKKSAERFGIIKILTIGADNGGSLVPVCIAYGAGQ
jgi:hypothetical protein